MTGTIWFDLVLLALLAAVLVALYRLQSLSTSLAMTAGAAGEADEDDAPRTVAQRGWPAYLPRLTRQAGYHPESMIWVYWLAKLALLAVLPLACFELFGRWGARPPWALVAILAVSGLFTPDLWLLAVRRGRRRQIRHGLSFFLDLIVSLLHSGLGLEEAFRRAARDGLEPGHPLALEAGLVDLELGAGKDRSQAFESMAERTGVGELRAVAGALRLGLRLGNPVQETLSGQADLLRTHRREEARREISMAPLKTLLPILLCGFPIFLVVVVFPAIVEIAELLGELGALFRVL